MLKSAYELALEKSGGLSGKTLTAAQKEQIAELELKFRAKIAELEIRSGDGLRAAQASGDVAAVEALTAELAADRGRLERELEAAKEKVRAGS